MSEKRVRADLLVRSHLAPESVLIWQRALRSRSDRRVPANAYASELPHLSSLAAAAALPIEDLNPRPLKHVGSASQDH